MKLRAITIFLLPFLTACGETKKETETRLHRERRQQAETIKATTLSQYPNAIPFGSDEPFLLTRPLTVDVQDSIAASPTQVYWREVGEYSGFDIHRVRDGLRLILRGRDDEWASLDCSDDLAARIRQVYKPDNFLQRFLFVFRLTSASPLRVELRGKSDGDGEDTSLSVIAGDIDGRLYTGTLVGFSMLDEGDPISHQ